jgi:hypothetical protein
MITGVIRILATASKLGRDVIDLLEVVRGDDTSPQQATSDQKLGAERSGSWKL